MRKRMSVLLLGWMLVLLGPATGLIAYDCEGPNSNISSISIKDIAPCIEPKLEYTSEMINVKVIQRSDITLQFVKTCLVEVHRLMYHCGMHSHSSVVAGGISEYIHKIGPDECRNVHMYRTLNIYNQNIGNIIINGTTTTSITVLGTLDGDGSCKGSTYHENGRTWYDVVIVASVKITTKSYFAKVKQDTDEISLMEGYTCPYLRQYCMDSMFGETTWEIVQKNCEEKLTLLYEGRASLVKNRQQEKFVVVEESEKLFTLSILKVVKLCSQEVWQTEHPKLMVLEVKTPHDLNPTMPLFTENTDLMSYINSKFLYIEQSYKRATDNLYADTVYRRCLLHREILRNRLLMAPLSPNSVVSLLQNKLGYVGRVIGEVIYIIQCQPKVVKLRRAEYCYQELPVTVENRSVFMAPQTHIIQDHAEQITCSALTPPLYHIDGHWIGLSPYPVKTDPPEELEVREEPKLTFSPIQPMGSAGLYTQEEISKVQKSLIFGVERAAVENILTRKMAGLDTDNQGYSTLGLFDVDEMKKLARSTFEQLWGWFTDLGIITSGIMGFYFIFRMIKYLIGVLLYAFTIYKTRGCGLIILASLWDTLATWLLHEETRRNPVVEPQNSTQIQMEEKSIKMLMDEQPSTTSVYPKLQEDPHWTDNKNQNTN